MKWIDLPPLWLLLFAFIAWTQARNLPVGGPGGPAADLLAGLLVGGGVLMIVLAAVELRRGGTTVMPHERPTRLVRTGVYARSRNPIYLGDAMILTGLILYWSAWPSLLLVPLFIWLITDRFILPEEERLARGFGRDFADYAARVRRWI